MGDFPIWIRVLFGNIIIAWFFWTLGRRAGIISVRKTVHDWADNLRNHPGSTFDEED